MRRLFDAFTSGSQSQPDYVGKNVKIGSYQVSIESVIAEGGFAIVYCSKLERGSWYFLITVCRKSWTVSIPVKTNEKGTKCALKRMFVNDEEQLAVCQYEIKLMRELNGHKNIVRYKAHSIKRQPNNGKNQKSNLSRMILKSASLYYYSTKASQGCVKQ